MCSRNAAVLSFWAILGFSPAQDAFAIVQTWRGPLLEDGHLMCQTIATAKVLTARFWKDDAGQDALLWMQNSQPKPPSKITPYSLRNHV